jgi:hypothetical protein
MFCPHCKAEYREGFTCCADCEVELVASLNESAAGPSDQDRAEADAARGVGADDPYCIFWQGEDARISAEICGVLDNAEIPYRVLRRDAQLFRIRPGSQLKIGVPFSLYDQAELAVVDAFGGAAETQRLLCLTEEDRPEFAALTRLPLGGKTARTE